MYQVQNPINTAFQGMGQASSTFGAMTKDIGPEEPKQTAGGAMMSGLGGASAGAGLGMMTGATAATTTAAGAAVPAAAGALGLGLGALTGIGAAAGIAAYLLS